MAITNYTELKAAITEWMDRADLTGSAGDFIALAEAGLNRLLKVVETDTTLTGTVASRTISISSLSMVQPIALYVVVDGDEELVTQKVDGDFAYNDTAWQPSFWAIDGTNIDFDCPLDEAYEFRFRYQGRFALSDAAPTNKLLTEHPDVYLAASIVWGATYVKNPDDISMFKSLLNEFVVETKHTLAQSKRSILTVDAALVARPIGAWQYR